MCGLSLIELVVVCLKERSELQLQPLSMTVSVVQVLCNSGSIFGVCVLSSRRSSCEVNVAAAFQVIQSPARCALLEQFPRVLLLKQLIYVLLCLFRLYQRFPTFR